MSVIDITLKDSLLQPWYEWGVIAAFLIAVAATVGLFATAYARQREATLWKTIACVASVLAIPALLARLHEGFAFEMREALVPLGIFSLLALVLAVVAAAAFIATSARPPALQYAAAGGNGTLSAAEAEHEQQQQPGGGDAMHHWEPTEISQPITPIDAPSAPVGPGAYGGAAPTRVGRPDDSLPAYAYRDRRTTVQRARQEPALGLLVIRSGPYVNTTFPLTADPERKLKIGAGQRNDYQVDDDGVSEQHLSISYKDGSFVLTDLDSTNGTYVNGKRADKVTLQSNDRIVIGETKMVFLQIKDDEAEARLRAAAEA